MTHEVEIGVEGAVMRLVLDRPDKRNALTGAMYAALADALERAEADAAVRVVTITARGAAFCAGNDLRDFQSAAAGGDPGAAVMRFLHAIASFPKIVVAGVAGQAVGIGTTMLLHCDLVVAAPDAVFALPFVDLGLVPEAASSLLLPRLIGPQRAMRHLLLGDPFDADTAEGYGLVTHRAPAGEVWSKVAAVAASVAARPPEAVRLTKRLLRRTDGTIAERIDEEGALFGERLRSPEAAAAFAAFFAATRR